MSHIWLLHHWIQCLDSPSFRAVKYMQTILLTLRDKQDLFNQSKTSSIAVVSLLATSSLVLAWTQIGLRVHWHDYISNIIWVSSTCRRFSVLNTLLHTHSYRLHVNADKHNSCCEGTRGRVMHSRLCIPLHLCQMKCRIQRGSKVWDLKTGFDVVSFLNRK